MRVKSLWASTLWRGVYVILIAAALVADFGFLEGRADWHILNYYTLLSNIACLIFFGLSFAAGIGALRRGERDFVWRPRCEGAIVFCIAVTGIVYATMLAPADIAEGRFFTFENLMLHYTGPIMAVMDWLLFGPKGVFRSSDPVRWLLIPLSYFGYILVRSTFAGPIGGSGSRFPYDFIDPAVQGGWGEMLWDVAMIAIGMAALGYVIYILDHALKKDIKASVNGKNNADVNHYDCTHG